MDERRLSFSAYSVLVLLVAGSVAGESSTVTVTHVAHVPASAGVAGALISCKVPTQLLRQTRSLRKHTSSPSPTASSSVAPSKKLPGPSRFQYATSKTLLRSQTSSHFPDIPDYCHPPQWSSLTSCTATLISRCLDPELWRLTIACFQSHCQLGRWYHHRPWWYCLDLRVFPVCVPLAPKGVAALRRRSVLSSRPFCRGC